MKSFTRISLAATAGLALAIGAPLAASAHVTLEENTAEAGAYTVVTFKVPNESDTASTNSVTVSVPASEGLGVRYVPVAGWSVAIEEGTDATEVTWTASSGSEIAPDSLQVFSLSLGAIPDTGSLVLPVSQGYTDGTVVDWADPAADAELPAPVLYVNDAPVEDHHGGAEAEGDEHEATPAASSSEDVLARILGIGGLVVGAVGIVLAVTARRKA
jgi:uncharacterized protein YcnI